MPAEYSYYGEVCANDCNYLIQIAFTNSLNQDKLFVTKSFFNNPGKDSYGKPCEKRIQEGHDGPVSLHLLIRKILAYQTLQYLGMALKHKTPKTGLKLVAIVLMLSNMKISKDFSKTCDPSTLGLQFTSLGEGPLDKATCKIW